jgi:hypothetical protein
VDNPPNTSSPQDRGIIVQSAIEELRSGNDSIFWLICFMAPAVTSMCVGIAVLAWREHTLGVAIVTTVALAYGLFQLGRIIANLAGALENLRLPKNSVCGATATTEQ